MGADHPVTLRTPAEREAFGAGTYYAAVHDLADPPERAYLEALPEARSIVLRRLVRGLYRGNPDGLSDPAIVTCSSSELPDAIPFTRVDCTDRDAPVSAGDHEDSDDRYAVLPFPDADSTVVAPVVDVHGHDRLRLADPVIHVTSGVTDRVAHPVDLVPVLRQAGAFADAQQADRIRAELAESAANLALSRLAGQVHARRSRSTESTFAAVVDGDRDCRLSGADGSAVLERVVTDGHPFHPAGKIRRGMSPTEGLAYAPEFTGHVDLRFVAVHEDRARRTATGSRSLTDCLLATFDGLDDAVTRSLPGDRDSDEYAVVPVHPWQYHHVVHDRYASQISDGTVRPVDFSHPATPLLNLRTVVPESTETATGTPPHCKLAIGVQTTNVERTLSPQAVTNGPRVTGVLRQVVEEEPLDRLGVLAERAAACYYPPGGPHVDGDDYDDVRHLSGLVRQNPYDHRLVAEGDHPVPAASLAAESPVTGEPLVREAVERYGDESGGTNRGEAALAFLEDYVDVVVPEQLRLLTDYGVALESHLQNCCVVFASDGRPKATLVRDLGGIRVHHGRLADRGFAVDTYPDSDLDADGERDLYRKLYYALFQNHLTELLVALVGSMPVEEGACWEVVADSCRRAFADLRADDDVPDARVDRDEAALFEDPIVHKALTSMRLDGKRHEYVTADVSNPLASPGSIGSSRTVPGPSRGTD